MLRRGAGGDPIIPGVTYVVVPDDAHADQTGTRRRVHVALYRGTTTVHITRMQLYQVPGTVLYYQVQ